MACNNPKYSALTGTVAVSIANPNLDGTGTMGTLLTAVDDGTIINAITVKATGVNAEGMIRLFIEKGGNTMLWREIPVPANVQSAVTSAYQLTINPQFTMESGDVLKASTQNGETWIVIAEAIKWINGDPLPTTQLSTPTSLSLTPITKGAKCSCDSVTNADIYEWQRADDAGFSTNLVTGTMDLPQFEWGNLNSSQTYYIRVRAKGVGYLDSNYASGMVNAG